MLTVALTSGDDGRRQPTSPTIAFMSRPKTHGLAHELHLATYHMLWELVHIVLNHRGIGEAA